jgi:hypothetical protein
MRVFTDCVTAAYADNRDIVVEYPCAEHMDCNAFLPDALQFADALSRTADAGNSPVLPPANIFYFNAKAGSGQEAGISFILATPEGH